MNKSTFKQSLMLVTIVASALSANAQDVVTVGKGSYAAFPPTYKGRTAEHDWTTGCDQSVYMQSKQLWVNEDNENFRPIPTNDWWTGLINAQFADALWSYPQMINPNANGITVNYPSYWNENGTEVKWNSSIKVQGTKFTAESAIADNWHDWDVEMSLKSTDGSQEMYVTLAHGIPFTWVELTGITPKLVFSETPQLFDADGRSIKTSKLPKYTDNKFAVLIGDDAYGVYFPEGCLLTWKDNNVIITPSGNSNFVIIGLLPSTDYLAEYAEYAYSIPRNTTVKWTYNEKKGELSTHWTVDAENLLNASEEAPILQGFIPHAYKNSKLGFSFNEITYLTPRGTMKMVEGTSGSSFDITYSFNGMLPFYPAPQVDNSLKNPFNPDIMTELITDYASQGSFGADTYWGGKGLTQMALNMSFAHQMGDMENFELCRDRLKEVMIDWLTFTPGETEFCFTYYPRWGGLVGYNTTYDSDTFNDHHFHYGYFTYAGALLCMYDEDFKNGYGEMLRLLAKDYANWDRTDTRFPFFRTFDPWVGHSYAGGLGDQGNSNGNGQESSSESMQGWGGVYLLGVALDDKEMRDAGLFGWCSEARATREYWFDVDSRFPKNNQQGNYDYTLYPYPYNSNITCKGIGWWTWFGGDPLYMHGIQWMPISPALDYLSWDRDFVEWAYNDMLSGQANYAHKWFEDTTDPAGNPNSMLASNDWGSVTLAYMQRALPDEAASIFDQAYEKNYHIATSVGTSHISYFIIHSHRTYGEIDTDVHADIPSAVAYLKGTDYSYAVYNPGAEREVNFYKDGSLIRTVKAPANQLTVFSDSAVPESVVITSSEGEVFPKGSSSQMTAVMYDQYGASIDGASTSWSISDTNIATVDSNGKVTVLSSAKDGSTFTVSAKMAVNGVEITGNLTITVNEKAVATTAEILPSAKYIEKGTPTDFTLVAKDQYGKDYSGEISWSIISNGKVISDQPYIDGSTVGIFTIKATIDGKEFTHEVFVTPQLDNIALGKTAYESSHENEGSLIKHLTDGDVNTRWGSQHTDNEWCYIDLGKEAYISSTAILWEAAFASSYEIQISADGKTWETVKTVTGITNSSRVNDRQQINTTTRYIRMNGLTRGTQYGYSIYEFQVFGFFTDKADTDIIGIDIISDKDRISDDETAVFTAKSYSLTGIAQDITVSWSTDNGTITSGGIFAPAKYGEATITASYNGLSTSRTIYVEETFKLNSLTVSPTSSQIILGKTQAYTISGTDQFGGEFDINSNNLIVTVYDAQEATEENEPVYTTPSEFASFDIETMTFAATNVGTFIVRFQIGETYQDATVEVCRLIETNLALNKPVTASSENENKAANAVDGNITTRWQAQTSDENESIAIDLLDKYILNKVVITWEVAFASKYHIQVSMDGENWSTVANETCSVANTPIETTFEDVPAQYVRLVCDERDTDYGISPYEIEVYGSDFFTIDDDKTAPIFTTNEISIDNNQITLRLAATDSSDCVFYEVVLFDNSIIDRTFISESAYGKSGEEVTITFDDVMPNAVYNVEISAIDAFRNSNISKTTITTPDRDITNVNLALDKNVTASSENEYKAVYVNDGELTSRWQAKPEDVNENFTIDLDGVYKLNRVRTYWEIAFAQTFHFEVSLDGNTWSTVASATCPDANTWVETTLDEIMARYIRLVADSRRSDQSQYGVSLYEIEVYGTEQMLSVVSNDGSVMKLAGKWDDALFADIDNESVTGYEIDYVKDAPAEIPAANPNCLIFKSENPMTKAVSTSNVVTLNNGMATAQEINLYTTHAFSNPTDITVNGNITLHLPEAVESAALILPFVYTSDDTSIFSFTAEENDCIRFNIISDIEPINTPLIYKFNSAKSELTESNSTLAETSTIKNDDNFIGTYSPMTADGEFIYNANSQSFSEASTGSQIGSFTAYLINLNTTSDKQVKFDMSTSVEIPFEHSNKTNVYGIDGIIIKTGVDRQTATQGLAPGIYIIGNQKIVIR